MNPPTYLPIEAVAERLGLTGKYRMQSALRAVRRGRMPVYRRVGRRILVRSDDLEELIITGDCKSGRARRARELMEWAEKQRTPRGMLKHG
jgi:hypothetical protein